MIIALFEKTFWFTESLSSVKAGGMDLLPENSVVNITNINIEQNQLVIAFNLKIPTKLASESIKDEINIDNVVE